MRSRQILVASMQILIRIGYKLIKNNVEQRLPLNECHAPINVKLLGVGRWGGGGRRPGDLNSNQFFLFKYPAPGKSSWVKKVQIPHTRVIIAGQKNSTNDQKSLPRADL